MKGVCDHRSESQFKQLLKLQFTAMVTYSFHLYSRSSDHFIQDSNGQQSLSKILQSNAMYKSTQHFLTTCDV